MSRLWGRSRRRQHAAGGASQPLTADGASWWRASRPRSLRCALRGHDWTAGPTGAGLVVVQCSSCSELVLAGFVDVPRVLGLPATEGTSWLGATSTARQAVDLVATHLVPNGETQRRLRRDLTGRPGDAIDVLAHLAAALSGMADPEHPLLALHQVALRVEMSSLDHELSRSAVGDGPIS